MYVRSADRSASRAGKAQRARRGDAGTALCAFAPPYKPKITEPARTSRVIPASEAYPRDATALCPGRRPRSSRSRGLSFLRRSCVARMKRQRNPGTWDRQATELSRIALRSIRATEAFIFAPAGRQSEACPPSVSPARRLPHPQYARDSAPSRSCRASGSAPSAAPSRRSLARP
jgi:hypothetical protein